ncbi:MAG: hypothetical protein U0Y68_00850 [Blastocatellia bacterium]
MQEDDPELYRRANRFLQIGLAVGIVILVLAQLGVINFDYGFLRLCYLRGDWRRYSTNYRVTQ